MPPRGDEPGRLPYADGLSSRRKGGSRGDAGPPPPTSEVEHGLSGKTTRDLGRKTAAGQYRLNAPAEPEAAADAVVEHIHLAATAGAPVRAVDAVNAIPGVGLDGDRYAYRRGHYQDDRVSRDLTLIEAETIEMLERRHGISLAPGETRRNVTTRGIDLNALVGRRFWVGEVLCQGTRLCEPCQYLADLTGKSLVRALVHRGGLRADILIGGPIRRGDSVQPA
jgi:MOSC domain-containing protein YiiM